MPQNGTGYTEGRFQLARFAKFNRPDPMRDWDWLRPHTMNLYEYVGNDPVNAWDPNGLSIKYNYPKNWNPEEVKFVESYLSQLLEKSIQKSQSEYAKKFLADIRDGEFEVNIDINNAGPGVIGNYVGGYIDVGQLDSLPESGDGFTKTKAFTHEIMEQWYKQFVQNMGHGDGEGDLSSFEKAHQFAIFWENTIPNGKRAGGVTVDHSGGKGIDTTNGFFFQNGKDSYVIHTFDVTNGKLQGQTILRMNEKAFIRFAETMVKKANDARRKKKQEEELQEKK